MAYISHDAGYAGKRRPATASLAAIGLALFGLTLGIAGAARLAGLPWNHVSTSLSARFWPVAEARILSAALDEVRIPTPQGLTSELALVVKYEFETDGRTVLADGASLDDRSGAEDRRLLSLYRRVEFARLTGRTMPVAYDPAAPSRAFLDTRLPLMDVLPGLGLGALLLVLGGQFVARAFQHGSGAHRRH
jgi:hypothetical protein